MSGRLHLAAKGFGDDVDPGAAARGDKSERIVQTMCVSRRRGDGWKDGNGAAQYVPEVRL